ICLVKAKTSEKANEALIVPCAACAWSLTPDPFMLLLLVLATVTQAPGKWPPDSLINTKVIPHDTPVNQVIGTMRNFTSMLGVRCHPCHEGEEGPPLKKTDFASDKKRMKLVARQMMRMVEEINHRLDTIPERPDSAVQVTCRTCHRGVSRPE